MTHTESIRVIWVLLWIHQTVQESFPKKALTNWQVPESHLSLSRNRTIMNSLKVKTLLNNSNNNTNILRKLQTTKASNMSLNIRNLSMIKLLSNLNLSKWVRMKRKGSYLKSRRISLILISVLWGRTTIFSIMKWIRVNHHKVLFLIKASKTVSKVVLLGLSIHWDLFNKNSNMIQCQVLLKELLKNRIMISSSLELKLSMTPFLLMIYVNLSRVLDLLSIHHQIIWSNPK